MVYFKNAFRWSFFHHSLKMHGPSCKKEYEYIWHWKHLEMFHKAEKCGVCYCDYCTIVWLQEQILTWGTGVAGNHDSTNLAKTRQCLQTHSGVSTLVTGCQEYGFLLTLHQLLTTLTPKSGSPSTVIASFARVWCFLTTGSVAIRNWILKQVT
jgi:hypothetical protein